MELLQIAKTKRLRQQEAGVRPLTILHAEDGADSLSVLTGRCEEVTFPLDREDRVTLESMEALLFKLGNAMVEGSGDRVFTESLYHQVELDLLHLKWVLIRYYIQQTRF